jgi:hypothetical protein
MGEVSYEIQGGAYAGQRRADPRIASILHAALGDARTVLNVGAGAGSYEPPDRHVIAIEPSAAMRRQRPAHLAPAIAGVAESLPLDDRAIDAAMAILTVHQWPDVLRGLCELRRVARGPVLVMTFDPEALDRWWLAAYAQDYLAVERRRYPPLAAIRAGLAGPATLQTIPIPLDCTDGFVEAYYGRPEQLLDPRVRAAQSGWSFVSPMAQERFVEALGGDLRSGAWDHQHGWMRELPAFVGALRLVIGHAP